MHAFLMDIGKGKKELIILDWYGGKRLQTLASIVNRAGSAAGINIIVINGPKQEYFGDRAREVGYRDVFKLHEQEEDSFDAVFAGDIYWWNSSILKQLSLISKTPVYVMTHRLTGEAGVENCSFRGSFYEGSQKQTKVYSVTEATWIRGPDGKISFSPHPGAPPFPPHPDNSEFFKPGFTWEGEHFECHSFRQFGHAHLIKVCSTDHPSPSPFLVDGAQVKDIVFETNAIRRYLRTKENLFNDSIRWLTDRPNHLIKAPVHLQTYHKLRLSSQRRLATAYAGDISMMRTLKTINKIPGWDVFSDLYPKYFADMVLATSQAATYVGRDQSIDRLARLASAAHNSEQVLKTVRTNEGNPGMGSMSPLILAFLVSIGIIFSLLGLWTGALWNLLVLLPGLLKLAIKILGGPGTGSLTRIVGEFRLLILQLALLSYDEFYSLIIVVLIMAAIIMMGVLMEEALSKLFPRLMLFAFLLEMFYNLYLLWTTRTTTVYPEILGVLVFGCFLMHIACMYLPFLAAVTLHFTWNFTVMVLFYWRPKTRVIREYLGIGQGSLVHVILSLNVLIPILAMVVTYLIVWLSKNNIFERFTEVYSVGEDFKEMGVVSLEPGTKLDASTLHASFLKPETGSINVTVEGISLTTSELQNFLVETDGNAARNWLYPVLGVNGMLWSIAKTIRNQLNCLLLRIHKDPHPYYGEGLERLSNQKKVSKSWKTIMSLIDFKDWLSVEAVTLTEALKAYQGRKKRKAEKALEDIGNGDFILPSENNRDVRIHMKGDETLKLSDLVFDAHTTDIFDNIHLNMKYIKPRAITDPQTANLMHTLPAAKTGSNWLKANSGIVRKIDLGDCELSYVFFYCSGATSEILSRYGEFLVKYLDHVDVVIVANGDDTVVGLFGRLFEGDFSMMDQSHDAWMLSEGRQIIYGILGHMDAASYLFESCYGPYSAFFKEGPVKIQVKGFRFPQLATGISDTTFWNSLTCIVSYLYVAIFLKVSERSTTRSFDCKLLKTVFRELGMNIKVFEKSRLTDCTFLKGWWVPGTSSDYPYVWMPLPSQVLKLAKVLKNPKSIYRNSAPYKAHAKAVSSTLKNVSRRYPILGDFLRVYDRLGDQTPVYRDSSSRRVHENPFKTEIDTLLPFDLEALKTQIFTRYSLSPLDLEEIKHLFDQVSTLPSFVSHPAMINLRLVDYGEGLEAA